MKKIFILLIAQSIGTGVLPSFGQEGLAARIVEARTANANLMKQYSWSSRTELLENGKVLDTRIDLVSYGPNGAVQRTILNDQEAALPRGFLRKRLKERQREKVEKYLQGLEKVLDQYTLAGGGKIQAFVQLAQIQAPDASGLLRLNGNSVVLPGDTFSLAIEAVTRQARQLTITTTFEGDPITLTASFRTLKSGLNHAAFAEVDVPAKGLVLQVHNFDYNQNN